MKRCEKIKGLELM